MTVLAQQIFAALPADLTAEQWDDVHDVARRLTRLAADNAQRLRAPGAMYAGTTEFEPPDVLRDRKPGKWWRR